MMAYFRDDRYFKIPCEYDPTNRLTKLPKELFMKIMYKAFAGEEADNRNLLCHEIRKLPVSPKTQWVRCFSRAKQELMPLNRPYPSVWRASICDSFKMIYQMPNPEPRTTCCSRCRKIIDHHLSVGLSTALYRLLHPPLGEEMIPELLQKRMKDVMCRCFEDFSVHCHTRRNISWFT